MSRPGLMRAVVLGAWLAALPSALVSAQTPDDLASLSIDELLNIKVTTASKKEEPLYRTAAAVYVVTQEQIRRSNAMTIVDLLRVVPGLEVSQVTSTQWAVSIRGFNGYWGRRVLVMIDGRSVYSPEYSTVRWDVQDAILADIDRIEVIRGPGAALWGANAMNGVVNIITKSATETTGLEVSASSGNREIGNGEIRAGHRLGSNGGIRVFGKFLGVNSHDLDTSTADDDREGRMLNRGGFRADLRRGRDAFTVAGEIYGQRTTAEATTFSLSAPYVIPYAATEHAAGGHVSGRWEHEASPASIVAVQAYYERTRRDGLSLGESRNDFDVELTHNVTFGPRNLVWGAGYRGTHYPAHDEPGYVFSPLAHDKHQTSVFGQYESALLPTLRLTAGTKVEYHGDTGWNVQPSGRLLWTARPTHTVWGSVASAVRSPSRAEQEMLRDVRTGAFEDGTPFALRLAGQPDLEPERMIAVEAGYRFRPSVRTSVDVTAFSNFYDRLILPTPAGSPIFEPAPQPAHIVIPLRFSNVSKSRSHGLEVTSTSQLLKTWQVIASYSWLDLTIDGKQSLDANEAVDPHHRVQVSSYFTLARSIDIDTMLSAVGPAEGLLPGYTQVDQRLGWRPNPRVELSVGVRNLFGTKHLEFPIEVAGIQTRVVIGRTGYGKVTWRF